MSFDPNVGQFLVVKGFTKAEILGAAYAMLTLVSILVLVRLVFQATRRKKLELQDYFLYFACACYLGACSLYITAIPTLFRIRDITLGKVPVPSDFIQFSALDARLIWAAQMCFWSCLWSVKLSLLCLYRKLLVGLPSIYIIIWRTLMVLCVSVSKV